MYEPSLSELHIKQRVYRLRRKYKQRFILIIKPRGSFMNAVENSLL